MSSDDSFVDRVQHLVSDNKRSLLIGAAAVVVAAGGVAYYVASTRGAGGAGDEENVKGDKKKDKRKKKHKKTVKDKDGPIIEERKPKAPEVSSELEDDKVLTADEIAELSTEERTKLAATLKQKGNEAYQARSFTTAADYYTRAIALTPKPEPVYYSNRAACYVNMTPPKHELVVEDCDAALKLDSHYLKALNRRAMALEALELYEASLRDYTATTILGKFQNDSAGQAVERVLKKLSTQKAAEILATREPRLPSFTFIYAYFAAFRPRALPALPENPSTGDNTLILALEALGASDYAHSLSFVNEAIEQGISWDAGKAEAFNLRGTFKFLIGETDAAKADLQASIDLLPSMTQSWVKIASVYMEQGDTAKAFECFEEAIKHNPEDPDIYYHRGQVLFIMNDFAQAAENYTKSTALDDQFVFSHIQLAVAQYKSGNLANSMATFRRTLKAFPQRSEPQNYYGELLLDQQRFQDAVEKFDRAIEIERNKTPTNVLPLVNKGLALFQWKQDVDAAERCCHEALRIDAECEAAVATLAQLSLQQGKVDQAVRMFERHSELARNEPELVNALTYQYASYAQLEFMKNYPELASQLSQLASGM
ncbi:mitochondrial outer membrane translocase receptor TOM70 [Auriscalpium vulgare]|uniref:Mitochondrial outer membrane translocase receptor TOM70 n=1 Tax=Auriscalpium vulgare TaxID=40419 RepID=A0ACB8RV67_9AGAM|nr:mitochondrial outer membrane translocase receptor TOM70 [Auriscalpium vulgare]